MKGLAVLEAIAGRRRRRMMQDKKTNGKETVEHESQLSRTSFKFGLSSVLEAGLHETRKTKKTKQDTFHR
jgi:hypothetical protein